MQANGSLIVFTSTLYLSAGLDNLTLKPSLIPRLRAAVAHSGRCVSRVLLSATASDQSHDGQVTQLRLLCATDV